MKSIVLVAIGAAASIGGCASIPVAGYDDGVDQQKVAAINSVAKSRGILLQWMNYPQRRSAPVDAVPSPGGPTTP